VKWAAVVVEQHNVLNPNGLWWTTRLFCYKEEYKRSMPGRIIGVSQDADGIVPYVWRYKHEQHIKREKTSNIFVLHRFYYL
jgi:glycine cleavage system pyridoxal-binding protein P